MGVVPEIIDKSFDHIYSTGKKEVSIDILVEPQEKKPDNLKGLAHNTS
jgi:hypothetical protein